MDGRVLVVVVLPSDSNRKRIGIQEENGLETKPEDESNEEALVELRQRDVCRDDP